MTVHLPHEAELECDGCGTSTDVQLTQFAGDPETVGVDDDDLPEGWTYNNGEHFCPYCTSKEPSPEPSETLEV